MSGEDPLFSLPAPPSPRGIDFSVSPDRTHVVYTQIDSNETRLVVAGLDNANPITLLTVPGADSDIRIGDWSPDSTRLLITKGTRTQCHSQVSTQADSPEICFLDPSATLALDLNGHVLWQHDGYLIGVTSWVGADKLLLPQDGTSDELRTAQTNGFCSTDAGQGTCNYLANGNETLADIAARFGIDPAGIDLFRHESIPAAEIYGLNQPLPYNTILVVPVPRVGRLFDLSNGQSKDLTQDMAGLVCVSPNGESAVKVFTRAEPIAGLPTPVPLTYIGASILRPATPSSNFRSGAARSWAATRVAGRPIAPPSCSRPGESNALASPLAVPPRDSHRRFVYDRLRPRRAGLQR